VWAAENDIPLLLYNNKGKVIARLWQSHFGSHAAIRIAQISFCQSADALFWLKELLVKKAEAQLALQQSFPVPLQRPVVLERMKARLEKLKKETGINSGWIRSAEAVISRWHWIGVAHALKNHLKIGPRNIRPARDRFNSLLNYLYGTLYGLVEGSQLAAGLDPHISIMHRMEYNTPSLVFDMIEPFRQWADKFATDLLLSGRYAPDYTEEKAGAIVLTSKGKKEILSQWFAYLQEGSPSPKKMVRRKDQVQQLCSQLAAKLLKQYNETDKKNLI
jgi:CRISPR-associated protein Cas1